MAASKAIPITIFAILLLYTVRPALAGQVVVGQAFLNGVYSQASRSQAILFPNFFPESGRIESITFTGGSGARPAFTIARRVDTQDFHGYEITAMYGLAIILQSQTTYTTSSNLLRGSAEVEAGSALIYVPTRSVNTGGVPFNQAGCADTYILDIRNWVENGGFPDDAMIQRDMCMTLAVEALVTV